MKEAGYAFRVESPEHDERFPDFMPAEMVPRFLAEEKAKTFLPRLTDEIVITADTVVILGGHILNKPADREETIRMLSQLAGHTHKVITAVCLLSRDKQDLFDDKTRVTFRKLTPAEIEYYVDTCKPFDKAGAYGAQDWLGMVGIDGLPGPTSPSWVCPCTKYTLTCGTFSPAWPGVARGESPGWVLSSLSTNNM